MYQVIVFRIELEKNVGPVTGCNIFSFFYFSCFGLSADTNWLKVNDKRRRFPPLPGIPCHNDPHERQ